MASATISVTNLTHQTIPTIPTIPTIEDDSSSQPNFTEEQIADFKEPFEIFDKDGDGLIDIKELSFVMRALGQEKKTEAELQELVNKVDAEIDASGHKNDKNVKNDKDRPMNAREKSKGTIDFSKYLKIVVHVGIKQKDKREGLSEAFRHFDREGKGLISVEELRHLMTNFGDKLTEQELKEMIREADPDKDGQVKYNEFIEVLLDRVDV